MQTGQYSQGSWDIKTLTNLATLFSQVGFNVGKKVWPFSTSETLGARKTTFS